MSDLVPLVQAHCVPRRGKEHKLAEARVRELLELVRQNIPLRSGGLYLAGGIIAVGAFEVWVGERLGSC